LHKFGGGAVSTSQIHELIGKPRYDPCDRVEPENGAGLVIFFTVFTGRAYYEG
jgi:hypothetical protein